MITKNKIMLAVTIALLTFITTAFKTGLPLQTYYTGSQYLVSTDNYTAFKYTKSYSGSGSIWITTYTIYHPVKGTAAITITATHDTINKKVTVNIEDANGGIFAHINTEEAKYTTKSLKPFGLRGAVGVLGGNNIPNQIKVKFVSSRYENVNVCQVAGSHENNDFEFFVLDDN